MTEWGRPEQMRLDNGMPWGTQSTLPSAMGLWLVGLGIELRDGRPARSTDNAVVERSHGVLDQWVVPEQCADFTDCQQQLTWAVQTQRERYRLANRQTRRQSYPGLYTNERSYSPDAEPQQWSLDRVRHYLARFHFQRKVERNGQITLFANHYSAGRQYARQYIEIQLDASTDQWVMRDEYGHELRRQPAKELSYELISQLRLAKRRRP